MGVSIKFSEMSYGDRFIDPASSDDGTLLGNIESFEPAFPLLGRKQRA